MESSDNLVKNKINFSLKRLLYFVLFTLFSYFVSFSSRSISNFTYSIFTIIFIAYNFYLTGDLIEYVLKIHYRAFSSLDRLISKILLGLFFTSITFFLSRDFFTSSFFIYTLWAINLIYFIYPTRSRLYDFSVRSHFSEFKYLDKTEKIILFFIFLMLLFSVPTGSLFFSISNQSEGLILFNSMVDALGVNLNKSIRLISYHYVLTGSLAMLISYSVFRRFFSRRVCLFGIFLIQTNWSFYKLYNADPEVLTYAFYMLSLLWLYFFVRKSLSYKSGFLMGLILPSAIISLFDIFFSFSLLFIFTAFNLIRNKNYWFFLQFLRYLLPGVIFCLLLVSAYKLPLFDLNLSFENSVEVLLQALKRKGFLVTGTFSFAIILLGSLGISKVSLDWLKARQFNKILWPCLFIYLLVLYFFGVVEIPSIITLIIIYFTFMSLVFTDFIVWSLSDKRDYRTIFMLLIFLMALLDSHFDGRVKNFISFFN
ncbi:MAG: hypothetical protein CME61_03090 [Halobacteriovoraceae bacterium]|nr:hypothetical protein [Halobacteriovoraceae bacterium]